MSYAEVGHSAYIGQVLVFDIRADKINFVCVVSALLVTGRSGAGKTSIVQAIAKSLLQDPRTYAIGIIYPRPIFTLVFTCTDR